RTATSQGPTSACWRIGSVGMIWRSASGCLRTRCGGGICGEPDRKASNSGAKSITGAAPCSHPEWQKMRERNEALDCRVYARAAAWILGADRWDEATWRRLEEQAGVETRLAPQPTALPEPAAPAAPKAGTPTTPRRKRRA